VPNVAPSFTAGANPTVLEDASAQSVPWATNISPGPPSEASQNVSFTVSSDNPALFSTQPAMAPDGTLTYTPDADANGAATVTVTAHDDGGTAGGGVDTSAPSTFTLTVSPVNDSPRFTAGPNQSVVSLLGAQSVPGWATGISPGPANESSQTVTFTVTNNNPGLFAVQPAVGANGTLTYTPTLLAVGSATVTVKAVDNGGTGSGGIDTSPPQTFTISIL
jgi:large repetitive protein